MTISFITGLLSLMWIVSAWFMAPNFSVHIGDKQIENRFVKWLILSAIMPLIFFLIGLSLMFLPVLIVVVLVIAVIAAVLH